MRGTDSPGDTQLETAIEIAEAVRRRELSATEVVERALERVERSDERLNSFVHVDRRLALADATRIDAAIAGGERASDR